MSTVSTGALRELHRIHRQLSDLRERLERGPKQLQARQANLDRMDADLVKTREQIRQTRMTADRKNLDLKTGEGKVKELEHKLNTCNSNKEYQALVDQIAAAEMAGSVLSDEILEHLEQVDVLEAKAVEEEGQVKTARQELDKVAEQIAATEGTIKSEIARLERELHEAETALPADFKQQYDRIVNAKGEDALAQVEDDCCGGCYQSITANQQNDLYMGRAVFCKACGRLLYLPEGHPRAGG